MLVKKTNSTDRETRQKQFKEFNRSRIENVNDVCTDAYVKSSKDNLSAADTTCKKAINNLSSSNQHRFCLKKNQKIGDILQSEAVNEEILEHAILVLKRFCDSYALTRVQSICARRSLHSMEFLNESKKANNKRCKNAINSLSNENKQKFCSANKDRSSIKAIKRICDAFIDNINAATNYKCIAPYLDAMWYSASEEELREIDSNCREAIGMLYGENKENFCNEYEKNIPERGSLLTNEGTIDDNIRDRAVKVVKEACPACPSFFHRIDKREINNVMKEIKMENAANGITEGINLSSQSIAGLTPKDHSLDPVNYTNTIASSLKNETKAIQTNQCSLETGMVTVMAGGLLGATVGCIGINAFWALKKWKGRDSGLESQTKEKQIACLKLYTART
ncbi:MAG: hypothetical protein V4471_03555 [Pseudomonadota bacterium]